MVQQANLVIIGVSAGLALGILIACLIFFSIRWYKNRAHLRQCVNEHSLPTLLIHTNGFGTSTDFSASLTSSIAPSTSENLQKNSHFSWWNHENKDWFASTSGILRYSYKEIQKTTQNFTAILGQGSFGTVYKAIMPTGGVVAVKVLSSNSKQGEKEFQIEAVPPVIHRDLKSTNILLDDSIRAKGIVVLVFQSAEEGGGGPKKILDTRALENVSAIFGLRVAPKLPIGEVASNFGPILAGCGFFEVVISRKRGHAVYSPTNVIVSLQHLVSRKAIPLDSQFLNHISEDPFTI